MHSELDVLYTVFSMIFVHNVMDTPYFCPPKVLYSFQCYIELYLIESVGFVCPGDENEDFVSVHDSADSNGQGLN